MYLSLLRFMSLSNSGDIEAARRVWEPYCGPFANTQKHWDCLRLTYITTAYLTEGAYPPGTRMNRDLVAFAKSGYVNANNWDPLVFRIRTESAKFKSRSVKVIEENER